MLYILDTADLNAIRHVNEFYPLDGVTTNPSIIAKEKTDFLKLVKEIRNIIGEDKMLHVQTTAKKAEDIVSEAKMLKEILGGEFYIKVPIDEEGLKATKILSEIGIPVTMTAIFTPAQALMAAKAGADYVAPYVNRLDNIIGDGCDVVAEITAELENYGLDCMVLAASFKNAEQVHKCALSGCQCVTVTDDVLVEGMGEIKSTLSNCCKPIPGDNIIGYITKGSGITVHRSSCKNIIDLDERLINVKWNESTTKKFATDLLVYTNTDDNLLDIIAKATASNLIIDSVSTMSKSDFKIYDITVLVENKEKLDKFCNELNNLKFVNKVERQIN